MKRSLYLSTLAVLAMLALAPSALAQDQYEIEAVPEILEEQSEDPQEPAPENVAEGQREAVLEEQVEARQGADLSPQQEAALERQAEAGNQQPKELPKEKGVATKDAKKDLPKTGGVSVGISLLGLGGSALLIGGGLLVRNLRNSSPEVR
jgi:LPXTG-motif cell wall-anchored protein